MTPKFASHVPVRHRRRLFDSGQCVDVALSSSGFSAFTSITIGSGFVAGTNTLDFKVLNGGSGPSPTGLCVDLSGTASIQ